MRPKDSMFKSYPCKTIVLWYLKFEVFWLNSFEITVFDFWISSHVSFSLWHPVDDFLVKYGRYFLKNFPPRRLIPPKTFIRHSRVLSIKSMNSSWISIQKVAIAQLLSPKSLNSSHACLSTLHTLNQQTFYKDSIFIAKKLLYRSTSYRVVI